MHHLDAEDWRPAASLEALRARGRLLEGVRSFFRERGVLEVETPVLGNAAGTDPHLAPLRVWHGAAGGRMLYLQTSPEFAMKRLLAAHGVPIYQVTRAFRDDERGSLHNPEFTLLEWYRPGWDHQALMGEVEALFERVVGTEGARRLTYREAFRSAVGLDPFDSAPQDLRERASRHGLATAPGAGGEGDREACLDFLFAVVVQPWLSAVPLAFVYDYPASQAALARIRPDDPPVAERFEAFLGGVEVANGYHELTDAAEQRLRFERDVATRSVRSEDAPAIDEGLLAALAHGMPDCAGVALGVDRLLMAMLDTPRIADVVAFDFARA